jgi:hypothetical protein
MNRFGVLIEHAVGLSSSPRSYRQQFIVLLERVLARARARGQICERDSAAVLAKWFNSTRHPEAASLSSQWLSERRDRSAIMAFCKMNGLWPSLLEVERIPPVRRATLWPVRRRELERKMLGQRKNTRDIHPVVAHGRERRIFSLFLFLCRPPASRYAVPLYSLGMHYRCNKLPADIYARLPRYPTWGMLVRAGRLRPGTTANVLTRERHEGNDRRGGLTVAASYFMV